MVPAWQAELAASFTDPAELLAFLELDPAACGTPLPATGFPFRVTRGFAERIRRGDPSDPLLRQVLPTTAEMQASPGFSSDPVGDLKSIAAPGLLHKYRGRVLLMLTGACAIHCRYCFRREFPYGENLFSRRDEDAALDYIAAHGEIREVIFSGGDPLVLGDERLAGILDKLAAIPHLRRVRIHSRLPVVLPARVTESLVNLLTATRLKPVLVIHANHQQEINLAVSNAVSRLLNARIPVLNQAVLLRGINDDAEALEDLQEALFAIGVLPYYLHLLDPASGTAHFEVAEGEALTLMETLRQRLPGYLVPKLVREVEGRPYKVGITGSG